MTKVLMREELSTNEQTMIVPTRGEGFNKKKNELKAFSEKLPKQAELPSVPVTGGLFGLFNYDVTGNDLNRLTESIQDRMIEQNKVLVRTIQEFNTIYDTFSALDKEYIQGILIALKAAEEANAKALKGIEGFEVNQNEIKQMINQQKQVIKVLQNFKEKIEKIEHLTDVDTIFAIYSAMQDHVIEIETKIEAQELTVTHLTDETKSLLSSQSDLQGQMNQLKENQEKQFQTVKQLVSHQNKSISKIETINIENKANIETLNIEVSIQGEKLGDLKQLFQDDIQTLSEKVIQNNAKLVSITNEVNKNKIDIENAMKDLNIGIDQQAERMSSYESELSKAKKEITELNSLSESISKIESINTENKVDIETLNKEVANQGEKLGDLNQLFQDDIQTLSEKMIQNNAEFDTKLVSITNEVNKKKIDFENAMKELNVGFEQQAESLSSYFDSELSKAKDEIRELNLLTVDLSKGLKTTRVFSFASIAITCVLVLLIISGVL